MAESSKHVNKQFDWPKLVSEWQASGLAQSAFCKPLGISHQRFTAQLSKVNQQKNNAAGKCGKFVSVRLGAHQTYYEKYHDNFTLEFPNGMKLSIPQQADVATFKNILSCLEK